jgi:hypothetical protein
MYLFKTHLSHIVVSRMHVPSYFGYLDFDVYFCIPFRYMLGENTDFCAADKNENVIVLVDSNL